MTIQDIANRINTEILRNTEEAKKPVGLLTYRLNALQYGTKKDEKSSNIIYSPDIINCILDASLNEINFCFNVTKFSNEQHKINTILLIMTKHIQEGVERYGDKMSSSKELTNLDNSCLVAQKNKYIRKSGDIKDEELWNG